MNKSDNDTLTDRLIGEAVMALLDASAPVNGRALINELQRMISAESDEVRKAAIRNALGEVRTSLNVVKISDSDGSAKQRESGTVFQHIHSTDNSRKH